MEESDLPNDTKDRWVERIVTHPDRGRAHAASVRCRWFPRNVRIDCVDHRVDHWTGRAHVDRLRSEFLFGAAEPRPMFPFADWAEADEVGSCA